MKTNRGNLKMNDVYQFIDITDLGEMNGTCCDNCGAPLRFVAHVKSTVLNPNQSYYVGTECVKTLAEASISNEYQLMESIKAFKKLSTAKNLYAKGKENNTLKVFKSKDRAIIVAKTGKKAKKVVLEDSYIFCELFKPMNDFIKTALNTEDKHCYISDDERHGKYSFCFNDVYKHLDSLNK
jgi:hypothetical protein